MKTQAQVDEIIAGWIEAAEQRGRSEALGEADRRFWVGFGFGVVTIAVFALFALSLMWRPS